MSEWLFQEDRRLEWLGKIGDRTAVLATRIPWEAFRNDLNRVRDIKDTTLGGRPPYDVVMMFKILILQGLYNLSDEDMEYQITDQLSFKNSWELKYKRLFELLLRGLSVFCASPD